MVAHQGRMVVVERIEEVAAETGTESHGKAWEVVRV